MNARAAGSLRVLAAGGLLATPCVLAFFSGGYFDEARLWALLATCVVLALAAVSAPVALGGRATLLALGGLWALVAWTALSISWAPLRGPAFHDLQRLILYGLAFTAGVQLLRERALARAAELALAAGGGLVLAYGLAGRLLPGVVAQSHGIAAGGRLDQPLTYWNAEGALAAMTLVLCTRIAGDATRRFGVRAAAAAVCAPAGMALFLTYSRGALGAAGAGLLTVLVLMPDRIQLRALVAAVTAAVAGAVVAAPFPLVASLHDGSRAQGVAALVLLLAIAAAAALTMLRVAGAEAAGRLSAAPLEWRALRPALGAATFLVVAGLVIATATSEHRSPARNPRTGATVTRLASTQSHRYAYWKVALGAFADHPLDGLGSGGFQVRWLERRKFEESVHDAHSLYIETLAELGIVGALALAAAGLGIALGARAALRADAVLAAGPLAAFVTWAIQTGVDWLWEMPAVSLIALALAALLVACGDSARPAAPA